MGIKISAFIVLCLLVGSVLICHHIVQTKGKQGKLILDANQPSLPFIFLYRFPKYPVPGEQMVSGLVVAIWQDGRVVRAKSEAQVGCSYVQGTLTEAQLADTIAIIEKSGILKDTAESFVTMDAGYESIIIRTSGQIITWAESPSFEKSDRPGAKELREYLINATPCTVTPVEGYCEYPERWFE